MRQGDVYWLTFPAPNKRRPAVILTRNSAIPYLSDITIAPITSTIRGIQTEVLLTPDDGMLTECVISLDNIQTVQKDRLGKFLTSLPTERLGDVRAAIEFAFEFDELG
jgi:mRNA interferase MazF